MSSVHNRSVLRSSAGSEITLNKWSGSRTVTVVSLFILSPNLPQKLFSINLAVAFRPGFWRCWECPGGCPLAPDIWECSPCVVLGSDTMKANQPIPVWFWAKCSDAVGEWNARLRVCGGWYTPGPRFGPTRECTRSRATSDQRRREDSNGCVPAWVWVVLPRHSCGRVERWVSGHCGRVTRDETDGRGKDVHQRQTKIGVNGLIVRVGVDLRMSDGVGTVLVDPGIQRRGIHITYLLTLSSHGMQGHSTGTAPKRGIGRGGDCDEGGEAGGCRRWRLGCLAATFRRLLGVGAVVVVDVPTPIRRPAGRVRVAVMAGRGRGGLTGGTVVVVGATSVPTPATGGTLNKFKASSTLMGKEIIKSSISWLRRVGSPGAVKSATRLDSRVSKGGGDVAEPTPAGDNVGVSMRSDNSVFCPPSLCRSWRVHSRTSAFSNGRDIHGQRMHLEFAFWGR